MPSVQINMCVCVSVHKCACVYECKCVCTMESGCALLLIRLQQHFNSYITHEKKEFCSFPSIFFFTFRTLESPIGGPLGPLRGPRARYSSVLLLLHLTGGPEMRCSTKERKKEFRSVFPLI